MSDQEALRDEIADALADAILKDRILFGNLHGSAIELPRSEIVRILQDGLDAVLPIVQRREQALRDDLLAALAPEAPEGVQGLTAEQVTKLRRNLELLKRLGLDAGSWHETLADIERVTSEWDALRKQIEALADELDREARDWTRSAHSVNAKRDAAQRLRGLVSGDPKGDTQ